MKIMYQEAWVTQPISRAYFGRESHNDFDMFTKSDTMLCRHQELEVSNAVICPMLHQPLTLMQLRYRHHEQRFPPL